MAHKTRKTEHAGPKRGRGAYWGCKEDAKRGSAKKRRERSKAASAEGLSEARLDDGPTSDLRRAVESLDPDAVKTALADGAAPSDPHAFKRLLTVARGDDPALACLKELLAAGADPMTAVDFNGRSVSALSFAVDRAGPEAIEAVAEAAVARDPAALREKRFFRTSPLNAAVERFTENPVALKIVLDVGSWGSPDGSRALDAALAKAVRRAAGAMAMLLAAGADPNARSENGDPAIVVAAKLRDLTAAVALLEAGADPWAKSGEKHLWEDEASTSPELRRLIKRAALKKMRATNLPSE